MEKYYRQYDTCRQNEKPFCTQACPFRLDVLDFQTKMAGNNYNAAYKTFRNAVAFPDIVAALCPEYCGGACPRKDLDQSVQLNLLEKTCVAKATKKDPTDYNVPLKPRKIAIIGAGTSGLACALRLAQKKYEVTIYEKSGRLGGKLWNLLSPNVFQEDIRRQLQFENYTLHLNTEVKSLDEIRDQGFEAVYAATGEGGPDFGVLAKEDGPGSGSGAVNQEDGSGSGAAGHCRMDGSIAVFAGGSLTGKDPIRALADGLDMAWAIEVFLKTGKLEYPGEPAPCRAVADPEKLVKTEGIIPSGEDGLFTDEEAAAEAGRCIRCQCDACMRYCDVCEYHKKWPMKIRDDVMATVAFSTSPSIIKKTPAKRLINTCTQCGLCDEVCPENIEIGGMLLEARRNLHRQNTMPGAYHQFWVQDMEFTNSGLAALAKRAPGDRPCTYAFFPGCQLGAADPRYVEEPYRWLLSQKPDMGLLLRCCGVPAEWAGNESMHEEEMDKLRGDWQELGKPVLILACPSCRKHLKEYLPEIETISLYEILDQWGYEGEKAPKGAGAEAPGQALPGQVESTAPSETYSVFDACSARHVTPMEEAVRSLARKAGVTLGELPKGDMHGCCGYGGHNAEANSEFHDFVVKSRSRLSENPYLVYCINCRDVFRGEGKPVLHLLDLLFDVNPAGGKLPGLTERRRNRVELKENLLREIWGETMEKKAEENSCILKIGQEVQDKMDRLRILEDDVCWVIRRGESSKRRTFNPEKGTYTCYRESGHITYWVEYRKEDQSNEGKAEAGPAKTGPASEVYEVVNVYSHRMKIKLEGVWNGRKTEADL